MRNNALTGIALFIVGCCSYTWAQRQVQDELGRTMTIPDKPHRVVCLAPSVTDTVYELGAGNEVVGAATMPPDGAKIMAFNVISERCTISRC